TDLYHEEFSPLAAKRAEMRRDSARGLSLVKGRESGSGRAARQQRTDPPGRDGAVASRLCCQSAGPHASARSACRWGSEGVPSPVVLEAGDVACGEVTGSCWRVDPGGGPPLPQAVRAEWAPQRDATQSVL